MSSRNCGGWGTPACLPTLVSQYHSSPLSEGPLPPTSQGGNISKCGRRLRPDGKPWVGPVASQTAGSAHPQNPDSPLKDLNHDSNNRTSSPG